MTEFLDPLANVSLKQEITSILTEKILSKTPADTLALGLNLAKSAKPGDVWLLSGDPGAGKTVFAKGFAEGLGVCEDVTSPTFTLLNIYNSGRLPLYHFDLYRLQNQSNDPIEAFEESGFDEYLYGDGVCLVEWGALLAGQNTQNFRIVEINSRFDDERFIQRREIIINKNDESI